MRFFISLLRFVIGILMLAYWLEFLAIALNFANASVVQEARKWLDLPLEWLRPIVSDWISGINPIPGIAWIFAYLFAPQGGGVLNAAISYVGTNPTLLDLPMIIRNAWVVSLDLTIITFIALLSVANAVLRILVRSFRSDYR